MAKRRNLKRDIGYIAGELFTEVLVTKMLIPGVDHDKADGILGRVLDMQDSFVQRAAKPDGKENKKLVKAYYKKLEEDLEKEIGAIVLEIQTLGAASKEA